MSRNSTLDRYIENFHLYFPCTADMAVDYELTGNWWLTVKLNDGRVVVYDDLENTIRNVPRDANNMTEIQCRKEFGYRLKTFIRRKCLTQDEVAKRAGISRVVLSRYITGKQTPSFYIVDKIAKALGCSVDEFRYL